MRILLLLLVLSLSAEAQSLKKIKKAEDQVFKKCSKEEIGQLNNFSNVLKNYSWEKLTPLLDEEHLAFQMNMYETDTFMFDYLGEPGKRNIEELRMLYIKETFRSGMNEKELGKYGAINFYEIKKTVNIKELYWIRMQPKVGYTQFEFLIIMGEGKRYIGRLMMTDSLSGLKIFGPMG